jgi:hypothetical protein
MTLAFAHSPRVRPLFAQGEAGFASPIRPHAYRRGRMGEAAIHRVWRLVKTSGSPKSPRATAPRLVLLFAAFDFLALSLLSGAGTVCSTTCSTGSAGGSAGNSSCTGSGSFAASFVPSSLLGCAFAVSLRLRLASSAIRAFSICHAALFSWQCFQIRYRCSET